jgi:hypothetical protein
MIQLRIFSNHPLPPSLSKEGEPERLHSLGVLMIKILIVLLLAIVLASIKIKSTITIMIQEQNLQYTKEPRKLTWNTKFGL